ncbi:lysocardiolipin acyltransferase 1-like protein [Pitangus sulphuratus]|nr:lysocardiolipin acyltransferase 1-like protein [Pitangus sulphuratus]
MFQTAKSNMGAGISSSPLSFTVLKRNAESHGVMERDILCTCTILGKFLWKYIHAQSFSTFDVHLTGLVSLDHRLHRGHLAHAPSGFLEEQGPALLEMVFGAKVVVTGDGFVPGERSVIIMNHRTRMDWMFLWNCLLRYSYLRLEKICLKSSLKSIPGFGWAMQVAAFVFIQRKWEDDKSHFEKMLDYFCDIREPLQLLIFPEGTDLTANTKARSNEFAEKNGLQKYEYVLHPRTTGFTFVVERLREGVEIEFLLSG